MKKVRSVYITEEMEKKLKAISVRTGFSFNKVVEQLLERALKEEK